MLFIVVENTFVGGIPSKKRNSLSFVGLPQTTLSSYTVGSKNQRTNEPNIAQNNRTTTVLAPLRDVVWSRSLTFSNFSIDGHFRHTLCARVRVVRIFRSDEGVRALCYTDILGIVIINIMYLNTGRDNFSAHKRSVARRIKSPPERKARHTTSGVRETRV